MNTEAHHLLGAYLLGGLDAGDLQAFEAHLQECGQCRSELSVLEKVPVLLDALPVPFRCCRRRQSVLRTGPGWRGLRPR